MAGNLSTTNSGVEIRAHVYSKFIQKVLDNNYLPEGLTRNVTDFDNGTTLHIPTIGDVTIVDIAEGTATPFNSLSAGEITMTISEYEGTGLFITDEMKRKSHISSEFEAALVPATLKSMKESYETKFLASFLTEIGGGDATLLPQVVNGAAHRWNAGSGGTAGVMNLADFQYARYSLTKAKVPQAGRVAIISVESEIALSNVMVNNVDKDAKYLDKLGAGFTEGRAFVRHLLGFDVFVSDFLPTGIDTGTAFDAVGPTPHVAGGTGKTANIFMCIDSDNVKPIMSAWRLKTEIKGNRNFVERRDEFAVLSEYGFGVQREESMVVVYTNDTI